MGHIVNPIIFRVGIIKSGVKWVNKWFLNLQKQFVTLKFIFDDYIIINYIFNFLKYLKKQSRQVLFTKFSKKIQKKLGTNKFRKRVRFFNYIVRQQSLVISHIKIIRILQFIKIGIFFFDSTFVIKLNNYFNKRVFFSFFNYKKWKGEQREKASLLSLDQKKLARRYKRYARKKIIQLLRERKFQKIRRLFPRYWFERKLKKPHILSYLGNLNRFVFFILYKRLFKNYFQTIRNNISFYKIYKNLLWYILVYRSTFNNNKKVNFSLLNSFLTKYYTLKINFSLCLKLFKFNFIKKYLNKVKNSNNKKIYIYNKFFFKFKRKLRYLIYKRFCFLIIFIKKYTNLLETNLTILSNNVTTSVFYLKALKNYKYCCKILEFVYFELENLKEFYTDNTSLINHLRVYTFESKIKIKKFTNFLLNIKLKKIIKFFQYRRFKQKQKKFIKIFFLSKHFYFHIQKYQYNNYFIKIEKLFKIFKILYLIFIKKIDWFFFKYLRIFFFKIFLYCNFQLLSLIILNNFINNKNKTYIINILIKLIIILQKQKYLFKKRLLKYNFLFQLRFHLFYIYSLLFKTSDILRKEKNLDFIYFGLNNKSVTSGVIINYICKLLKNRYPIRSILKNIIFDLKKYSHYISGFRIICAGRLTKKQRAAYMLKSSGAVKLSSINVDIDYATDIVVMRHGTVGFKVWLARSQFFIPYFYRIQYNFFN